MYATPTLVARFARNTCVIRADQPLSEDQMRAAAPSIFAEGKHESRSERYTYIPTIDVLRGLRKEGFEPFMVAQGHSRIEGKTEYTKHMIRIYCQLRTMSRPSASPLAAASVHAGHSGPRQRPFRNASSLSSGRYRPGLPVGGVVLSRISCFSSRFASKYICVVSTDSWPSHSARARCSTPS